MQYLKKLKKFKGILLVSNALFGLFCSPLQAQNLLQENLVVWKSSNPTKLYFEGAAYRSEFPETPVVQALVKIQDPTIQGIQFQMLQESLVENLPKKVPQNLTNSYQVESSVAYQRGEKYLAYKIVPLRKEGNKIYKLDKYAFQSVLGTENRKALQKKPIYAANSVLASGEIVKVGTTQNGIHRIDYATFRSLGLNPDIIDPRNIKLFGRGGGMVPQPNAAYRPDDLVEIPILFQGEQDGKFNPGDFFAFYGESQTNRWEYDATNKTYYASPSIYCDTTYYFLQISTTPGNRIAKITSPSGANNTVNSYTFLSFYNNEKSNLTKSGKVWVGEEFDRITSQNFNVSIPNLISSEPIKFRSSVTARSFVNSDFTIQANGVNILSQITPSVNPGYEQPYTCGLIVNSTTFLSQSANFTLNYTFNKASSGSIGWLDFFEIQAKVDLKSLGGNFIFRDASFAGTGNVTRYEIGSNRTLNVWDVTNPLAPFIIEGSYANNIYTFSSNTDSLKVFAAYDATNYLQVSNGGKLANQNLHALSNPDGFIITHPDFMEEANRLAEFHRKKDNLKIHVVSVLQIYNEFSGGTPDLCAVRDFLRMFYNRATTPAEMPKYVTLFGRASYDYKYRQNPNSNFIPTFESWESFGPTTSYCSDDFLGFLDDTEGKWDMGINANELLDIGIGRLPVSNATEAKQVVDKIISYSSTGAYGSWRNSLVFVADDEDNNNHQTQADNIANNLLAKYPEFNVSKIYLDAYTKESTAGGARFPDAQKAINNSIQSGMLIFNYTGHGGEVGLTAERVMGIDDINSWTNGVAQNEVKLPLFLTATCEFSRFDDPARVSAGELALLNPNGGAIGLFTTVRLVYSGQNEELNKKFFENVGFDSLSQLNPPRLGDIVRKAKNAYPFPDANTRNFTLLGDPFVTLAYPNFEVKTTQINGKDLSIFNDTLKALRKFEISGEVTDKNGVKLNDYQGVIYPVVYDKFTTYSTMGNNPPESTPMAFSMQNNVLYRGKASVINGAFTFSFVVPKDIAYEYGYGKVSYYANKSDADANGYYNKIFIGGTSDSSATDTKGPEIKIFLNDEKFVAGGLTGENPKLIVKLFDENGINTTGRGIGRDLVFVLNNKQTQAVIVNDYYQAALNSYQSGEVIYNIKDLPAGKHQIKFRAYDVYNNMSEATLDFEVANSEKPSINYLLNYPNPFNNKTTFHFDHNLSGNDLQVMIQIFTINGKLVKTLQTDVAGEGTHFDALSWDGKDEYGDKLASGVYIYKCKVKAAGLKTIEKIEKLVILN
jgi:hypothetical protein